MNIGVVLISFVVSDPHILYTNAFLLMHKKDVHSERLMADLQSFFNEICACIRQIRHSLII